MSASFVVVFVGCAEERLGIDDGTVGDGFAVSRGFGADGRWDWGMGKGSHGMRGLKIVAEVDEIPTDGSEKAGDPRNGGLADWDV